MVLPHVAASRIVRQVSGLAHLSPGEWLQCLLARNVVQIFIQSTQKTTQFPLIRAEQGLRSRKGALAFEDHVENADHCRQQRHELQRSYGHG